MTTPHKDELPSEDMTAGKLIRWPDTANIGVTEANGDVVWWAQISTLNPNASVADMRNVADRIVAAWNAYEPMREALQGYIDNCTNEECEYCINAWAALSTLPVSDRHHSGSDFYQADASAPALSEKFNLAGEWLPIASAPKDGTKIDLLYPYPRGRTINCYWGETDLHCGPLWVKRNPTWGASGLLPEREWNTSCFPNMEPTHWMPAPALPDGWLNFSNDAGSDAGSLKPDTSLQPASEAEAQ